LRLTPDQITIIQDTARRIFGPAVRVFLFGSRTNDQLRGGDIDLLVQAEPHRQNLQEKLRFLVQLKLALGDRRIDVVFHRPGQPFIRAIQSQAIPLWT
jgi:uncharacterized protein